MARPTKQGVDYFPVDVQFDEKIELFIADKGAEGLGVLIIIWQLIYQNEGYYIKDGEDLHLLIRRRAMLETQDIGLIIDSMLARGVFDKEKRRKYGILTSKAAQKRYFIASKKKKSVSVIREYLLNGVSVSGNIVYTGVNVVGNATNVEVEVKEEVEGEGEAETFPPPKTLDEIDEEEIRKIWINVFLGNPGAVERDFVQDLIKAFDEKRAKQILYNFRENGFNKIRTMRDALDWKTGEIKPKENNGDGKLDTSRGSVKSRLDYRHDPNKFDKDVQEFTDRFG